MDTKKRTRPTIITIVLTVLFAAMMIAGGIGHIASPSSYDEMIPAFIPDWFAHGFAFVAELGVAALLLIRKTRRLGALAFAALMIIFLPIHVVESFRENPATGSTAMAWVRNGIQLVLIWLGYHLATRVAKEDSQPLWAMPGRN